jgi:hypothetical protein
VPLPKRLCIRGRNLLHIMAKRGKLASNIVRRHSRFDANEAGWQVRKPQCDASARDLLSQHDGERRPFCYLDCADSPLFVLRLYPQPFAALLRHQRRHSLGQRVE